MVFFFFFFFPYFYILGVTLKYSKIQRKRFKLTLYSQPSKFWNIQIKAIKPIFWKTKIQGNQLITNQRYNSVIYDSKLDIVYKLFVYIEN
jgi:hypothetical protein